MDLDIEEEETSTDDPEEMTTHGEAWSPVSEPEATNVDPNESPEDDGTGAKKQDGDVNPLRRLIVKAVLDAMVIMEDILEYGKEMLFTSVGDDIDIDIPYFQRCGLKVGMQLRYFLKRKVFLMQKFTTFACAERRKNLQEMDRPARSITTTECGALWKAKISCAAIAVRKDT